jgi:hypothetical protein
MEESGPLELAAWANAREHAEARQAQQQLQLLSTAISVSALVLAVAVLMRCCCAAVSNSSYICSSNWQLMTAVPAVATCSNSSLY